MATRRHGGGGEQEPLLQAAHGTATTTDGGGGGGVASAAGGGGLGTGYGSGEPQPKTLTEEPPDLSTFNNTSSFYHVPGSRRRSSWVVLEKPPVQTIDILRQTRQHRLNLSIFLLAALFFITMAIVLPGWTLGSILTTSVLMPQSVKCPSGLKGADGNSTGECEASTILIYNTRVNYGLFGRLKYKTTADSSVHTQLTTAGGRMFDVISKSSSTPLDTYQFTYQYWGQHFPGLMRYVRATQALVVGAWAGSLLSLLLLGLVSARSMASKLATVPTVRIGCVGLLASAFALALAMACWLSIPIAAFSTMCAPSASAAGAATAAVTCTRLDEAFCAETDHCHVDNLLSRTGSSGAGLILFSLLLQCVCAGFWHTLGDDIGDACDGGSGGERFRCPPPRRPSPPVLGDGMVA